MKTIFLIDDLGDAFAYFPENSYTKNYFLSYAHIGQHSGCHPDYANECREANYNEYYDLLKELISIGYKPEILNTQTVELSRPPTNGEIKFGEGSTHYLTYPISKLIKRDGSLKRKIKIDGLYYKR